MAIADKHVIEVWKSPPSLDCTRMEVSNLGRVRTIPYVRHFLRLGEPRTCRIEGRVIKCAKDHRGRYLLTGSTIRKSLYGRIYLLHRLVAECFVKNPKPDEYDMVFFKDGDLGNCKAENLVWGCRRDRSYMLRGKHCKYIVDVFACGTKIGSFRGCSECARSLGCTKQAVQSALMNGHLVKGFVVEFRDVDEDHIGHSLEEARKEYEHSLGDMFMDIPDAVYAQQKIDITPKAVF